MELFELFFNSEMTDFWVNVLLPILSIIIPVFATVYTVNNTINARNKENHQPYLVLEKVLDVDDINKFSYYLTPVGRNYLEAHPPTSAEAMPIPIRIATGASVEASSGCTSNGW